MNAPPQSVPRPPADLWAQMETAGRTGDTIRLGILRAEYAAWLTDHGYTDHHAHGSLAPDTAYLPEHDDEGPDA